MGVVTLSLTLETWPTKRPGHGGADSFGRARRTPCDRCVRSGGAEGPFATGFGVRAGDGTALGDGPCLGHGCRTGT
jgi:hypothetical protein